MENLDLLSGQFEKRLSSSERIVLRALVNTGRKPITKRELALNTGIAQRQIMKIIRVLVVDYGVLIVGIKNGRNNGFYLSADEQDRLAGVRHLHNERRSIETLINSKQAADADAVSRALELLERE